MPLKNSNFRTACISFLCLAALSLIAVAVEGYHLGVDDAEIYIPAIKRVVNPQLYPVGQEYFLTHAKLSILSPLVGRTSLLLHLAPDVTIFLCHLLSIFLFIWACWELAKLCFVHKFAQWAAVTLTSLLLAVPATGTALVLMDPYFTARSFSTPATLFTIVAFLKRRWLTTLLCLAFTAAVHPQMAVFSFGFLLFLLLAERVKSWQPLSSTTTSSLASVAWIEDRIPKNFHLQAAQGAYHETLYMRTFFFVSQWQWYEWIGVFAPLAIFFAFPKAKIRSTKPAFTRISFACISYGIAGTIVACIFSSSVVFEYFVRIQPMRCFLLVYIFLFLFLGGILGEYLLNRKMWRWAALFLPIGIGMFCLERSMYPSSRHVEIPGQAESNAWAAAFYWIRDNTPVDAVFAMDPKYMHLVGEDQHGFRAIAERSRLVDYYKDSGVASLFPGMSDDWKRQQIAVEGWGSFQVADFDRVAREQRVQWAILATPPPAGLACAYRQMGISVCKIGR